MLRNLQKGRCVKHKTKLTRELTRRRVSHTNKHGEVSWIIREGSILVCPMAGQQSGSDDITNPKRGVTANKKLRITDRVSDGRITAGNTGDEGLPLDSEEF